MRRCLALCSQRWVPDPHLVHPVQGRTVLDGVAVYRDYVTPRQEDALADEVGQWVATKHAKGWGQYRHPKKEPLRNTVEFFGTHTHTGKAVVRALDGQLSMMTVAVQHAPAAFEVGLQLRADDLVEAPPTGFRFQEYTEAESGILSHRDAKWQGSWFATISLLSDTVLRFVHHSSDAVVDVHLPRRSLVVVRDPANSVWQHSIPFEPAVAVGGRKVQKDYRCSIVYYAMDREAVDVTDDVGMPAVYTGGHMSTKPEYPNSL